MNNSTSDSFDAREDSQSPLSKLFREITLDIYLKNISPNTRVLDCGCGIGGLAIPLARKGCKVDALDANPDRVTVLDELKNDLEITTHCCTLQDAQFSENSFDHVISRQFMSYFKNWKDVLKQQLLYCKPGGTVIYHQHSSENYELSLKLAKDKKQKEYVKKGYNRNTRYPASHKEISRFCNKNNCNVIEYIPVSFYLPGVFHRTGLDPDEMDSYKKQLNEFMKSDDVYNFMKWYETVIIRKMPASLCCSFVVIIKNEA